MTLSNPRD
uniref:Uncharacterized protein n=1 Tax=Anguilla anguilla TaxID=7936 RepID=A0A0E9TEP5_ANGAN